MRNCTSCGRPLWPREPSFTCFGCIAVLFGSWRLWLWAAGEGGR